jgi:hypothetical protein
MAGKPLIRKSPDFYHLELHAPQHTMKYRFEEPVDRPQYIALNWVIFGTSFDVTSLKPNRESVLMEMAESLSIRVSPDFCCHELFVATANVPASDQRPPQPSFNAKVDLLDIY